MYETHLTTLPSGLPVLVLQRDGLHCVDAVLALRAGPRFETRQTSGLSHLLEHMLFRGTEAYPRHRDFHEAVESIGGPLQGSTGRDMSLFGMSVSPRDLDEALALLAEATLRPTLEGLDLERRLVLEELLEERDERDRDLDLENLSRGLLWPGDPVGLPVLGSRDNVEHFDERDLRAFHQQVYRGGNALLVIAGPVDPDEAVVGARRAFRDMPSGPPLPLRRLREPRNGPFCSHVEHDASQVEMMLSFPAVGLTDPRVQGIALIQLILGDGVTSRLQWNVCEVRALAYSIYAQYDPMADVGVLDVEAAVAPEGYLDLMREVLDTLREFKDRGPTDAEVERARKRYLLALEFAQDSPSALASYHLSQLFGVDVDLADRLATLPRWNRHNLRALGRQLLSRRSATLVAVGPFDELHRRKVERLLRML